ncbi:MAG: GDP-mannose 4,6-dehydratase [Terriglobales bacterium]
MRVLITGGAGFIGSHLAFRLLQMGHEVSIVDDLSTGSMENLGQCKGHPAFEYHLDTIFNHGLMAEQVDLADLIFHLAAAVGVRRIVEMPVRTIETNVRGSELVLELAAKKGKRLLITSTSEVYGKSDRFPFRETDDLVFGSTYNSRWSYACSKAIDEFLALAYHRERKLPVTVVRLFNTTGPRQTGRYGMVLPTFARQALSGEPVTVYGSGEQSRCFCHVDDVLDGLVACALMDRTVGEIFNIGNTEEISIRSLAEKVIAAAGSKSQIRYVSYEEAYGAGFEDMDRRVPDISKAHEWFAYAPKRTLAEIIEAVLQDARSRLHRKANAKVAAHAG